MAERSKAPDSRITSFPVPTGPGVLVSKWRRGFESHSWHFYFPSFFLFAIMVNLASSSFFFYKDKHWCYLKLKMLSVIIPFKNNTGFAFLMIHFAKRSLEPALMLKNSNRHNHKTFKDHNYNRLFLNMFSIGYFSISMSTSCSETIKVSLFLGNKDKNW